MATEYTTERGITIRVVPIPLMLDELRKAWEKRAPAPVMVTEKLAGGGVNEYALEADDAALWQVEDPETFAPYAEAWAAYQAELAVWNEQQNDAIWRAICMRAIQVEMPADGDWIDEHLLMGFEVPDAPAARRLHWIRTEVVGGIADMLRITALANGADVDQEALAAAEDSFRSSLQRTLTSGLADKGRPVADQRADGDAANGEGVGDTAISPGAVLGGG